MNEGVVLGDGRNDGRGRPGGEGWGMRRISGLLSLMDKCFEGWRSDIDITEGWQTEL